MTRRPTKETTAGQRLPVAVSRSPIANATNTCESNDVCERTSSVRSQLVSSGNQSVRNESHTGQECFRPANARLGDCGVSTTGVFGGKDDGWDLRSRRLSPRYSSMILVLNMDVAVRRRVGWPIQRTAFGE